MLPPVSFERAPDPSVYAAAIKGSIASAVQATMRMSHSQNFPLLPQGPLSHRRREGVEESERVMVPREEGAPVGKEVGRRAASALVAEGEAPAPTRRDVSAVIRWLGTRRYFWNEKR